MTLASARFPRAFNTVTYCLIYHVVVFCIDSIGELCLNNINITVDLLGVYITVDLFDVYITVDLLDIYNYYSSRQFPIQNFHRRTTDIL